MGHLSTFAQNLKFSVSNHTFYGVKLIVIKGLNTSHFVLCFCFKYVLDC